MTLPPEEPKRFGGWNVSYAGRAGRAQRPFRESTGESKPPTLRRRAHMSLFGVQVSIMVHVLFGVLGIILAVALLVYVLNISEKNIPKIKSLSLWTALSMIASYVLGGWWYVVYYVHERDVIRSGAWKWAHTFFMEWKEHVFFALLFLSVLLPVIAYRNDLMVPENRKLLLLVTWLIVLIGLAVDGSGAVISRGVIVGYMGRVAP
jgi:hypothetical protein